MIPQPVNVLTTQVDAILKLMLMDGCPSTQTPQTAKKIENCVSVVPGEVQGVGNAWFGLPRPSPILGQRKVESRSIPAKTFAGTKVAALIASGFFWSPNSGPLHAFIASIFGVQT
jgi:hypothetical protein